MKKQFRIVETEGTVRPHTISKMQLVFAVFAGVMLIFAPAAGHAYQVSQSFSQPESRDQTGRITVEASVIHVVTCNGAGENGGQFYIYQYVNRQGFRAIRPPDWGHVIGGRDYPSFEQAAGVACGGGQSPPLSQDMDGVTFDSRSQNLTAYGSPSAAACRADCQNNPRCAAYSWVKPGGYRAGDPPVCYLMATAGPLIQSSCCISAVKGGATPPPPLASGLQGSWRYNASCSAPPYHAGSWNGVMDFNLGADGTYSGKANGQWVNTSSADIGGGTLQGNEVTFNFVPTGWQSHYIWKGQFVSVGRIEGTASHYGNSCNFIMTR